MYHTAIYLDNLATSVINSCEKNGWGLNWQDRGVYMHLEVSELIEALRGKHGDPLSEAGDVLFTFMAILAANNISFLQVIDSLRKKIEDLDQNGYVKKCQNTE